MCCAGARAAFHVVWLALAPILHEAPRCLFFVPVSCSLPVDPEIATSLCPHFSANRKCDQVTLISVIAPHYDGRARNTICPASSLSLSFRKIARAANQS
jgi:hypothetical protein